MLAAISLAAKLPTALEQGPHAPSAPASGPSDKKNVRGTATDANSPFASALMAALHGAGAVVPKAPVTTAHAPGTLDANASLQDEGNTESGIEHATDKSTKTSTNAADDNTLLGGGLKSALPKLLTDSGFSGLSDLADGDHSTASSPVEGKKSEPNIDGQDPSAGLLPFDANTVMASDPSALGSNSTVTASTTTTSTSTMASGKDGAAADIPQVVDATKGGSHHQNDGKNTDSNNGQNSASSADASQNPFALSAAASTAASVFSLPATDASVSTVHDASSSGVPGSGSSDPTLSGANQLGTGTGASALQVSRVTLQLPEEAGSARVQVALHGTQVSARIVVPDIATRMDLQAGANELREALTRQGFEPSRISIASPSNARSEAVASNNSANAGASGNNGNSNSANNTNGEADRRSPSNTNGRSARDAERRFDSNGQGRSPNYYRQPRER